MDGGLVFVHTNGGADDEADYPYRGTSGIGLCDKPRESRKVANIQTFNNVPPNNEAQLALTVAKQPVAVGIQANQAIFHNYRSGVLSGNCGQIVDHAVLVVGFTDSYWIVKNSWGTQWGMKGYVNIQRDAPGAGPKGMCGIATMPVYGVAKPGKPVPIPKPTPPHPAPKPTPPPLCPGCAGQCVAACAKMGMFCQCIHKNGCACSHSAACCKSSSDEVANMSVRPGRL